MCVFVRGVCTLVLMQEFPCARVLMQEFPCACAHRCMCVLAKYMQVHDAHTSVTEDLMFVLLVALSLLEALMYSLDPFFAHVALWQIWVWLVGSVCQVFDFQDRMLIVIRIRNDGPSALNLYTRLPLMNSNCVQLSLWLCVWVGAYGHRCCLNCVRLHRCRELQFSGTV